MAAEYHAFSIRIAILDDHPILRWDMPNYLNGERDRELTGRLGLSGELLAALRNPDSQCVAKAAILRHLRTVVCAPFQTSAQAGVIFSPWKLHREYRSGRTGVSLIYVI